MVRKMKKLLAALLLAFVPALALAQPAPAVFPLVSFGYVTWAEDTSATSLTYCSMQGINGDAFGKPILISIPIKTTGSSTSVTEVTASSFPFTNVSVGDMIIVKRADTIGTTDKVAVTARADASNITVSSAVNWSNGYSFSWLKKVCGTTAADGWIQLTGFNNIQSTVEWVTKAGTSIDYSLECSIGPGLPIVVNASSATAVGQWSTVVTAGIYDRCRLGLKISGDSGTNLVNAYLAIK